MTFTNYILPVACMVVFGLSVACGAMWVCLHVFDIDTTGVRTTES